MKVVLSGRRLWLSVLIASIIMCTMGIVMAVLGGAAGARSGDSPASDEKNGAAAIKTVSAAASEDSEPVRLTVVMYHGFTKDRSKQNKYMIDPSLLENDLQYLTENGYHTIVTKELTEHFSKGTPLSEKPIMLTFDDGYYSNYLYAYPLLKKYGCRAVLSPIGNACSKAAEEKKQNEFYSQCTISQLAEMSSSGVMELAYHTYGLHTAENGVQGVQKRPGESAADYTSRLKEDIRCFREWLKGAGVGEVKCFTYPFGAKSACTEEIVRNEGFTCAMDCEAKVNLLSSSEDLYSIHRFLRDGADSVFPLSRWENG